MMDQLIGIATELEPGLRDFFSRSLNRLKIRSVSVDVDDYWEYSELLHQFSRIRYSPNRDFPYDELYYPRYIYDNYLAVNFREYIKNRLLPYGLKTDFSFRPAYWEEHCKRMGYREGSGPIIIKVTLINGQDEELPNEMPRVYNEIYPIVYEVGRKNKALYDRELSNRFGNALRMLRNRFFSKAASIKPAKLSRSGTLGGILRGGNPHKNYLVTCAHVLGPVGTVVQSALSRFSLNGGKNFGNVIHYSLPPLGDPNEPCNVDVQANLRSIDLALTESDLSLKEIEKTGFVQSASRISLLQEIRKNDTVSFIGKTSGYVEAKVGAVTVWDQISFPDGVRCFGRIFQLKPTDRHYIHRNLASGGDSGAWIVSSIGPLTQWYGMLISSDGNQAYGCFAEFILDDGRSTVDANLSL